MRPADLLDLFAAAVDRPLHLACREARCRAWYYATNLANVLDRAVCILSVHYDETVPLWMWRKPISVALTRAADHTTRLYLHTSARWRRATDCWKATPVPARFGAYLAWKARFV